MNLIKNQPTLADAHMWVVGACHRLFDEISDVCLERRNEGIDMTHNPEFTTCEFYQVSYSPDAFAA